MSLTHTLLGLLLFHPRSGYDLHKRMEHATFLLESASLRRIYPTLKQLAQDNLVVFKIEPQEGKPDRKIYSVTDKGEAQFLSWLKKPPKLDGIKLEHLMAKFFFYGMLDQGIVLSHLHLVLEHNESILEQIQAAHFDPPAGPCRPIVDENRVMTTWEMMLDYGCADIKTQIEWLKNTIHSLENQSNSKGEYDAVSATK